MKKVGKLLPNRMPDHRWQIISVDIIRELPESRGYNAILVVVDCLSKRIHTIPTVTSVDSEGMARLFLDHVWRHHGLPEEVISDRGSAFVSHFSKELAGLLGIKLTHSTAYHPQTDGQTERVNQEIETYLRVFINHHQDDWADWLPLAEFSYNNRIHTATHRTPFELDTGQHPRMGTESARTSTVEAADAFASRMSQMQEEAKAALTHAADEMAKYYDRHRQPAPEFKVGEKVWLNAQNYTTDRPTKKLDHRWIGPFRILKVVSPAAVKLQLTVRQKGVHPVVSVSNIRRHTPDDISERPQEPHLGPDIIDGKEEYEAERILDSKFSRGRLVYLVKFQGWPNSDNEWLPAANLEHATELLANFHRLHPLAAGNPSATHRQPNRLRTSATSRRRGLRGG